MPHSHCQEPLHGLAIQPNLAPNQYAWLMAGSWSPKPSWKDTMNQGGLGTLVLFHLHQHHSILIFKTCPHNQPTSWWLQNSGRCPGLALKQDSRSKAGCCSKAKARTEARDNESYGWLHASCLCFHQIIDSRVIGVQHWLHHQCHQCLRVQEDQGICTVANGLIGNPEAIWRSTCWSLRMRTPRMLLHTKVGAGT